MDVAPGKDAEDSWTTSPREPRGGSRATPAGGRRGRRQWDPWTFRPASASARSRGGCGLKAVERCGIGGSRAGVEPEGESERRGRRLLRASAASSRQVLRASAGVRARTRRCPSGRTRRGAPLRGGCDRGGRGVLPSRPARSGVVCAAGAIGGGISSRVPRVTGWRRARAPGREAAATGTRGRESRCGCGGALCPARGPRVPRTLGAARWAPRGVGNRQALGHRRVRRALGAFPPLDDREGCGLRVSRVRAVPPWRPGGP